MTQEKGNEENKDRATTPAPVSSATIKTGSVGPSTTTPLPPAAIKPPEAVETPPPATPPAKEDPGDEMISMSKKELADVMAEVVRRETSGKASASTNSLLEQILDQQTFASGGPRMMAPKAFAEADIDKDDYLDKPVVLFCYSHSHICMGDKRFGQSVKTPYDTPIRFKHLMRYKKPGTSRYNDEMITMSSISIRSKKEAVWMKKHTLWGIKYFEDIQDAKDVSKTFSDKLVETSMHLNTLSEYEVIERAKAEEIEITTDLDDIRRRLVYIVTEKAMQGDVQNRTHHKIAAVAEFDHKSDADMDKATVDAKKTGGAPVVA